MGEMNTYERAFESLVEGLDMVNVESKFEEIWGLDWAKVKDPKPGVPLPGIGWGSVRSYLAYSRMMVACEAEFHRLWDETQEETEEETVEETMEETME